MKWSKYKIGCIFFLFKRKYSKVQIFKRNSFQILNITREHLCLKVLKQNN